MDQPKLIDELAKHNGKTVLLGVRSSFFFIGPCEEAQRDMRLIGLMARVCVAIAAHKKLSVAVLTKLRNAPGDIGERRVVRAYVRNPDLGGDEIVILVEGKEFGSFWTRDEYLAGRQTLQDALAEPVA